MRASAALTRPIVGIDVYVGPRQSARRVWRGRAERWESGLSRPFNVRRFSGLRANGKRT